MLWRRLFNDALHASEGELTKRLAETPAMKKLAEKTHEVVTRIRNPNDPRYLHLRSDPLLDPNHPTLLKAKSLARKASHVASEAGKKFAEEVKKDLAKGAKK